MRDKNNFMARISCHISKTIRFDDYTFEVINTYRGYTFAEKLRNYVFDVEHGIREKTQGR